MAGTSLYFDALNASAQVLLGKAVIIKDGMFFNNAGATSFLQLFDASSTANVILGTTIPYAIYAVSASDNDSIRVGAGLQFFNGIVAASTTTTTGTAAASTNVQFIVE